MLEGRGRDVWDRTLTVALPIMSIGQAFTKGKKQPLDFVELHPYRQNEPPRAKTKRDRELSLARQVMAQNPPQHVIDRLAAKGLLE